MNNKLDNSRYLNDKLSDSLYLNIGAEKECHGIHAIRVSKVSLPVMMKELTVLYLVVGWGVVGVFVTSFKATLYFYDSVIRKHLCLKGKFGNL